jgi:hypothetical protein
MKAALFASLLSAGVQSPAWACAVCFGDKNSAMARAIWPGIYLLIGVVTVVLLPIVYLGITWMRRERRHHRAAR